MKPIQDIENIANSQKTLVNEKSLLKKNIIECVKDLNDQSILSNDLSKELILLKRKYKISPSKAQLGMVYDILVDQNIIPKNEKLQNFIKTKEMRSLSGVIVMSVITSPYPEYVQNGKKRKQIFSCKHDCFYCPKEIDDNGNDVNPRSYLSAEPTVARGLQNDFDPVRQFNDRAYQYLLNRHYVDKIELIVLGGTWTEYPKEYQETFIRDLFWAANNLYNDQKNPKGSLEYEQKINEKSKSRIIGLTLEMRPDSINEEEIFWLRKLGCTRVQLGIQHTDDSILKKVNRGCNRKDAENALTMLKNYGYKVDAHWMPDLPGSSPEIDKNMFRNILYRPELQFDQWKIYPTSVVPWTKIKKWFDEGTYTPYTDQDPENLMNVLMMVKQQVHPWIRLNRVVRDIPNKTREGKLYIYGGNKKTNLRQMLHQRLDEKGMFCGCIRCREVKGNISLLESAVIVEREYESSGGIEYFISIESGNSKTSYLNSGKWFSIEGKNEPGILYGFIRLRLCNNKSNKYLQSIIDCALIRELHIYGQVKSKYDKNENNNFCQNKGLGKQLMNRVEKIAIKNGYQKIAVISGIGVKDYYRKLGYKSQETYMIKEISIIKFYLNQNIHQILDHLWLIFAYIYIIYTNYNNIL